MLIGVRQLELPMRRGSVVSIAVVVVLAVILATERQLGATIGNLVECLAVAVLLGVLAWAACGVVRNTLTVAASLVVGLAIVDGGLWAAEKQAADTAPVAATTDSGLDGKRRVFGWGPSRPGIFRVVKAYPNGRVVYDVRVTIDQALNRRTLPSANRGAIAFFGDSFVFGDGLNDDEALPQTFARLNAGRIPVQNLAFSGWSPAQNLAGLQSSLYRPLLEAPRHFVLFTAAFHVERTACKGEWAAGPSSRYVLVDGAVVDRGPCATPFQATLSRFAHRFAIYDRVAGVFSRTTRRDVLTYLKIVETFVATAKRDYGAATTILFKTMGEDFLPGTGFSEAMLIEALRNTGADVLVETLPPIADPSLYQIADDGHPTRLANEAVARQIADHLTRVDPAALAVAGAQANAP